MTRDEDTPVVDAIRAWYRESDVEVDRETGVAAALYGSFVALGVALGSLLTVRLLLLGLDPAQFIPAGAASEPVFRVRPSDIRGVLRTMVLGAGVVFAAGNAIVVREVLRSGEEVGEA